MIRENGINHNFRAGSNQLALDAQAAVYDLFSLPEALEVRFVIALNANQHITASALEPVIGGVTLKSEPIALNEPAADNSTTKKPLRVAQAIAYFLTEVRNRPAHEIKLAEIIAELGCAKSTLSRGRRRSCMRLWTRHKSLPSNRPLRMGSKDENGNLEAIGDCDIDFDAIN